MRRIFVDLEMHPIVKIYEGPGGWRQETIEIGAVMLDEDLEEIGSFKEYVKPAFSDKVYGRIRKLTGITAEMLADADSFEAVLMRFCEWCGSSDYIIYSWSDSDIWQIIEECRMKCITCNEKLRYMLNHWKDFQEDFCNLLHLEKVMNLGRAVTLAGLDFSGREHDGLADARDGACDRAGQGCGTRRPGFRGKSPRRADRCAQHGQPLQTDVGPGKRGVREAQKKPGRSQKILHIYPWRGIQFRDTGAGAVK